MTTDAPKAPRKSAAQRRAERTAERVDAWLCANTTLRNSGDWAEGVTPYDALSLAQWLAGNDD